MPALSIGISDRSWISRRSENSNKRLIAQYILAKPLCHRTNCLVILLDYKSNIVPPVTGCAHAFVRDDVDMEVLDKGHMCETEVSLPCGSRNLAIRFSI